MSIVKLICLVALIYAPQVLSEEVFNSYIIKAVEKLNNERRGGGYDISKAFTQNLLYGPDRWVKASAPPLTMCVAGVSEVIIEALNLYYLETNDKSPFKKLPISSWNRGNLTSIRANIFMYKGSGSFGTGHALEQFGLGEQKNFSQLISGDFVNFSRVNGSGHAVVFMGFINSDNQDAVLFDKNVIGFKYFSAQGKGKPDAGFAYRYAYFDGNCPQPTAGRSRDCGVIRSDNKVLFNAGSMYHPMMWKIESALNEMKNNQRDITRSLHLGLPRAFIESMAMSILEEELEPNSKLMNSLNGETTD